jgi:hypothetical protein
MITEVRDDLVGAQTDFMSESRSVTHDHIGGCGLDALVVESLCPKLKGKSAGYTRDDFREPARPATLQQT